MNTEKHGNQERLNGKINDPELASPLWINIQKEKTNNHMPKDPKQKTPFLPFPKTRNHIINRKLGTGVAPGIMVLIFVPVDDGKQRPDY